MALPHLLGEPAAAPDRTAAEYPACVQHEALINAVFRSRDVTIVCPYDAARLDAARLDAAVLAEAYATYPLVVDEGVRAVAAATTPIWSSPPTTSPWPVGTRSGPRVRCRAAARRARIRGRTGRASGARG
ncbi:MEDS domain-containing protein [Streptomyces sp. NPDC102441]|uniref:MEDS domain-containing protein n=1 Tax=Streptomyces sp. NPDC102441 TaxID=3366176 RepID=UPI00381EDC72